MYVVELIERLNKNFLFKLSVQVNFNLREIFFLYI